MTIAIIIYKIQDNDENKTINLIIASFSRPLKGWWDYYVSDYKTIQKIKPKIINGQVVHSQM